MYYRNDQLTPQNLKEHMTLTKDKANFLLGILNLLPNIQITMTIPDALNFDKMRLELIPEFQAVIDAPDEEVALELGDADGKADAATA